MATPQKKQEYHDPEEFANKLVTALKSVGVDVTRGQPASQRAIAPAKSTSSAPATTRSTTSQPYKVPGKYNPFPNQGAGMGARTKAWSADAQAIGQGSARGVTGQRPAQVGNTMQGGFTRGPGGMPQQSGPPIGRPAMPSSAGFSPMPGGAPRMPQSLPPMMPSQQMPQAMPGPYDSRGPMPPVPEWLMDYQRPPGMMPEEQPQDWRPALWSLPFKLPGR